MGTRMKPFRSVRRSRSENGHRVYDIIGIVLIAAGLITSFSLFRPDTGIIGGVTAAGLRSAFGSGAWAAPVMLILLGLALLLGRREIQAKHLVWGGLAVYLAMLGFIARPLEGDYFDPDALAASGGFVGAVIGWAFRSLLGDAMWIGLGAFAMIGVILCANVPVQAVLQSVQERARRLREKRLARWTRRARRPARTGRAVVEMPAEDEEAAGKPKVRPKPKVRETVRASGQATRPAPKEGYTLPPLSLLQEPEPRPKRTQSEIDQNIEILENTLEEFGIEANVVEIAHGPTLTRYEIQLGPGVRVSKITSLADNLAMSLAASHVRVEAPIPGKAAIGVEVPNAQRAVVRLREVADTDEFLKNPSRLAICLGQDVSGENVYADLAKMPHLLIGGATNSGKSIGLGSVITSLLLRNTPKDLRLALFDPKRVELSLFDGIPHLFCPVVTDLKQMPGVLKMIANEMDRRYGLLADTKSRNIEAYNAKASFADRLPYLVVVIDELADLMILAAKDVETSIARIAQLARAIGIHLIIATQRPSVDVITGTIKANISSRIAFAVSSQVDSRTILDAQGAENLISQGDMLFLPIDAPKALRVQGCFVSEQEIGAVCAHWREQASPEYILDPASVAIAREEARLLFEEESDPYWDDAVQWVTERGQASTSMLQRRFSIGFQRASRLLDLMEERGIVAPRDGPRPREVLVSPSEADEMLRRRV